MAVVQKCFEQGVELSESILVKTDSALPIRYDRARPVAAKNGDGLGRIASALVGEHLAVCSEAGLAPLFHRVEPVLAGSRECPGGALARGLGTTRVARAHVALH